MTRNRGMLVLGVVLGLLVGSAAVEPATRVLVDTDSPQTLTNKTVVGVFPSGAIMAYGGSSAPSGFLLCDGSAVSRTTYAALFAAIGTTYGAGDGSTTFNVPDLRGRSPLGAGQGAGLTNRSLGATGGEETHALSLGELAAHTHDLSNHIHTGGNHTHDLSNHTHVENYAPYGGGGGNGLAIGNDVSGSGATINSTGGPSPNISGSGGAVATSGPSTNISGSTGSGTPHNTMHPFLVVNFIIKT